MDAGAMKRLDRAVEKAQKRFVFNERARLGRVSVAFPTQAGLAQYSRETQEGRVPVGNAFAQDFQRTVLDRVGIVKVLLFEEMITVSGDTKAIEVRRGSSLIGSAARADARKYAISNSSATLTLSEDAFFFENGSEIFQFPRVLQTSLKRKLNVNVIYDPSIRSIDPALVMAVILMHRMCLAPTDF